jgi:hypothetical protein
VDDRPLVFVAMPFGKKPDPHSGVTIDFDAIYEKGIRPAVKGLEVDLVRADEERGGGIIHLQMFQRLLVAEVAIVDVSIENANVYYELGVRHTARPQSTIVMRARGVPMPFDIRMIRAVTYDLTDGTLSKTAAAALSAALRERLEDALRDGFAEQTDSPIFQLIPSLVAPRLPVGDVETFRNRAKRVEALRARLVVARGRPREEALATIGAIDEQLGAITATNAESAVDLLLSYRDVQAFDAMIALVERMPERLVERNVVVREQYAFALNRRGADGDRDHALRLLNAIVEEQGNTAETCGLIGRIYKDDYVRALTADSLRQARASLKDAIEWYRHGFYADPRDVFPGVNLATLLVIDGRDAARSEAARVIAALHIALARRRGTDAKDYWTLATLLEIAVVEGDWDAVEAAADDAIASHPTLQQLTSTRNNLQLLQRAAPPHVDATRLAALIDELTTEIAKLDPAR